jgi:hypothetical protein
VRSGLVRRLQIAAALLAAAYLLLLADWRGAPDRRSPVVRRAFEAFGPVTAGAARMLLTPPVPVVRAGYGVPRAVAETERDPLEVRALVLRAGGKAIALVLVDLVVIPEELARDLEAQLADLHLDGVVLVATHTHSSVGGFDRRLLAQVVGTGRYRADVAASLRDRSADAVRRAAEQAVPVHAWTGETRLAGWAQNRSTPGAPIDDALTVMELRSEGGARLASIAVVAAHPTLFPRQAPHLSADYPGEAMRRLGAGRGPALLLQGAEGDASPPAAGVDAIATAGAFVAERVNGTLATARQAEDRLGYADVEIGLPPAEPQGIRSFFLRRPASNVLAWVAPKAARITVVTIGDMMLLGLPGEPTALAAAQILAALPPAVAHGRKVRVVGLVQGYVGYIDTPERVHAGHGEARRAWFGPDLLDTVTRGLQVAVAAGRP